MFRIGQRKSVIRILMKRDGLTKEEAMETLQDCEEEINEALAQGAGYDEIEEIMADYLGLEMDYLI